MNLEIVAKNLEKRGFKTSVFQNKEAATDYLNKQIDGVSVAFGGSVTIKEMELFQALDSHNEIWWHGKGNRLKEYGAEYILEKAMSTDVYISSVNALSEQGQLINIDGRCNRIASTVYGHKKVYFVIGKNKIADSFEKAMWRARNIAAPKNAQRLGRNTPCAIKGDKCYDCSSPERICRGFLTIECPPSGQETEIILIDENLGY